MYQVSVRAMYFLINHLRIYVRGKKIESDLNAMTYLMAYKSEKYVP